MIINSTNIENLISLHEAYLSYIWNDVVDWEIAHQGQSASNAPDMKAMARIANKVTDMDDDEGFDVAMASRLAKASVKELIANYSGYRVFN